MRGAEMICRSSATYTPPSFDDPGGWEFTDEEKRHESDKHFAKMCSSDMTISEAFGPDAWGDNDMSVSAELGRMLNEYRHSAGKPNYRGMLEQAVGKLLIDYAMEYVGSLADDEAENTIADSMVYVRDE